MISNHINIKKKSLKIIFSGTQNFSAQHLKQLIYTKHNIVGVLTKPDLPSGRGKLIVESPVKKIAKEHIIPVFQPKTLEDKKIYTQLYELNADIMIVVAYGLIIPKKILNMFSMGCINVHASLLPRWRGATPIQSAILYGDSITGVTIIQMDEGIDTGKILCSISCNIEKTDTSQSLHTKLSKIGCKAILLVLHNLKFNKYNSIIQSKLTTYSKKINKQDAQLNWSQDATKLEKCIRAFNPWPVSFFKIQNVQIKVWAATVIMQCNQNKHELGKIILINKHGLQIQTKNNILNITKVQLPGKKIMHAYNLINSKIISSYQK
ncbi:MAG: methionyl-tRNA formyltransferase [Buchnera aphidicola (Meitanaphis microgallis)]